EADGAGGAVLAAQLVQVDGPEDAERDRHQRGEPGGEERPDDGGVHATAVDAVLAGEVRGEELPGHDPAAPGDHVPDDGDERHERHHEGEGDDGGGGPVGQPPAGAEPGPGEVERLADGRVDERHQAAPRKRTCTRLTITRPRTLTTIVSTRRKTPSAMSAERNVPEDSPNWLTMTAGMASPVAKRLATIWGRDPMTRATAIVSPMARTRPSIVATTVPPKL